MLINCPGCGPRDNGEFAYLGDAAPARPDGMSVTLDEMGDYLHLRDNPAGTLCELWYHSAGCRAWLVVTRDTRTHAVSEVAFARDVARRRDEGRAAR